MSEPENVISLRGSSEIVTEFFKYSVHNILYQRCIYPPETFKREPKFGISMMVSSDEPVVAYIDNIIRQLNGNCIYCQIYLVAFKSIHLSFYMLSNYLYL